MPDRLPIEAVRKDVLSQIPQQPFRATVKAINLVKGGVQLQIGGSTAWQWYRCLENVGLDHVSVGQQAVVAFFDGEPIVVGFLWKGGKERKVPKHTHAKDTEGGQVDWDDIWADAVHNHSNDAEGGQLDHGGLLGLADDDHPQYAAIAQNEDITGQWDLQNDLTRLGPNNAWRLGEIVLNLDLTGTDFDTPGEMNAVGVRLSDTATPFTATLIRSVSGTWAHSAGNGWAPTMTVDDQGPAMLLPLARGANWELDVDFTFTPGNVNERFQLAVGYAAVSNHVGAVAAVRDDGLADSNLKYSLATNDGDDTWTQVYGGNPIVGASGNYEIRFRCQNGCIGVYDDEDDAWHWYTGRQNAGRAYTADYAVVQFFRYDANMPTLYLRSLKLSYLL